MKIIRYSDERMLESSVKERKNLPLSFRQKLKDVNFFIRSFDRSMSGYPRAFVATTPRYVGVICEHPFPTPWTPYVAVSAALDKCCGNIHRVICIDTFYLDDRYSIIISEFKTGDQHTWQIVFDSYNEMNEWLIANGVTSDKVVDSMDMSREIVFRTQLAMQNSGIPKFDLAKIPCQYS